MTRLIDADALTKSVIEVAMDEAIIKGSEKTDVRKYQSFLLQIAKQKIIEAVPVIRCKDCKYYTGKWCTRGSNKQLDENDRITIAMGYCSRAERKEE